MEFVTYVFVLLIVWISLILGAFIAFFSKEELKPGKKYFLILKKVLFLCICSFPFFMVHLLLGIAIFVCLALFILWLKPDFGCISDMRYYLFYALLFFLASFNQSFFLTQAGLIFLVGIPTGTLFFAEHVTLNWKQLIKVVFFEYYHFLAVAFVLGLYWLPFF